MSVCSKDIIYCVKSVHIRSYFGPYFPAFRLNAKRYSVSLHIQSKCGKMQNRITRNTDNFYAVISEKYSLICKDYLLTR